MTTQQKTTFPHPTKFFLWASYLESSQCISTCSAVRTDTNAIKLTRNSQIKQTEQFLLRRAKNIRSDERGGYALVAAAFLKKSA